MHGESAWSPVDLRDKLVVLGGLYGVSATPFYEGAISTASLGGAWLGGYVGFYFGGEASATTGIAAGAAVGAGALAGVSVSATGLAGYAIASAGYCATVCASDHCYYP